MDERLKSVSCSTVQPEVLDVEPLRSLAPMLPSLHGFSTFIHPSNPSLVCLTPFLPFASCLESQCSPWLFPLHPAFTPTSTFNEATQETIHTKDGVSFRKQDSGASILNPGAECPSSPGMQLHDVVPLNKLPLSSTTHSCPKETKLCLCASNHAACNSKMTARKVKKAKHNSVESIDKHGNSDHPITPSHSKESAEVVLMTFGAIWRWLMKFDETNEKKNSKKHPHLRAGGIMYSNDLRINGAKRVGAVPGIEVGDIFYFRAEMSLVGLHLPFVGGIDYKILPLEYEDCIAVSVVASGGYQNEDNDVNTLIYSGQGRPRKKKANEMMDQKLERGNLALERSLHRSSVVRVIRTQCDLSCPSGKVYIYDGLYKITQSWLDKRSSRGNVFKYKLLREPGQPDGVALWKMAQRWKENPSTRSNIVLPDISLGIETTPVCIVNELNDEKRLSHFSYVTKVTYPGSMRTGTDLQGCMCDGVCNPGVVACYCAQRNGGFLPYLSNGLLVSRSSIIYECNANCRCDMNCRNRVTQKGAKLHLEVFRTQDCGWGVRSLDPIRAGTFICEYTGEVIDDIKAVYKEGEEDEYIFQPLAANKTFKWNHGPEMIGGSGFVESQDVVKPLSIIISAKDLGNVSRFMNHSCSPNLFWQPVQHDHDNEGYPHIMFFAIKHIPPMTELTYDYGSSGPVTDTGQMLIAIGHRRTKKCLCGSMKCEGLF